MAAIGAPHRCWTIVKETVKQDIKQLQVDQSVETDIANSELPANRQRTKRHLVKATSIRVSKDERGRCKAAPKAKPYKGGAETNCRGVYTENDAVLRLQPRRNGIEEQGFPVGQRRGYGRPEYSNKRQALGGLKYGAARGRDNHFKNGRGQGPRQGCQGQGLPRIRRMAQQSGRQSQGQRKLTSEYYEPEVKTRINLHQQLKNEQ
jgi:hypothetical protein